MNRVEFPNIEGLEEGKDYISLVAESKSQLGRSLSVNYNYLFRTVIGDVRSIGRFIQFVSTKYYPSRLVTKGQFSNKDLGIIRKLPTIKLPNYWAIVAYVICTRVAQDSKLQKWLKENKLPLTIAKYVVRNKYVPEFSTPVLMNITKLGTYLDIVRNIEKLLKEDRFNDESITELIKSYKAVKHLDVFDKARLKEEDKASREKYYKENNKK